MVQFPKTPFYSHAVVWKSIKKTWEEGKKYIYNRDQRTHLPVIFVLNRALNHRLTKSTNKLLVQHSVGVTTNGPLQ